MREQPTCHDCGLVYGGEHWIETSLPNDVWARISPTGDEGGLLCIACISARCKKAGLDDVAVILSGLSPLRQVSVDEAFDRGFKCAAHGAKLAALSRPKIVCLCGSTRFMEAFHAAGWSYTLKDYIVLSVGVCKHADKDGAHGAEVLGPDVVERLDTLHLRKIDLADSVFVLNVGGYICQNTRNEINYAESIGKPIAYLEPLEQPA